MFHVENAPRTATESVRPRATRPLVRARRSGPLARIDGDRVLHNAARSFAAAVVALLLAIVLELVRGSGPSLARLGWHFVVDRVWDPVNDRYGAAAFVFGTAVTSAIAIAVAAPAGIAIGVFLTEIAPRRVRAIVGFLIELLAAIPSIVYGLWGLFVLAPIVRSSVAPALHRAFGVLPLFDGPSFGVGVLTAALVLAVMILPFTAAVSRDVLAAVPRAQRDASLALGATRWETIRRVVIPYGRAGLAGAVILALGRALGETMAVTMVIGNTPRISASLFAPGYTMASVIANEYAEAAGSLYLSALTEIGLVLFGVTFVVNGLARVLVARLSAEERRS